MPCVAVNFATDEICVRAGVDDLILAGSHAISVCADIAREEDVTRMFETAAREFGRIDALVNNGAITGGFGRVDAIDAAALARMLSVNVGGTILCAREGVKRMSTRHGGRGGSIVNISSIAARTGSPGEWVHYAASKGAVNSFTIGLARQVGAEGIRVNAVAPGRIAIGLRAANGEPGRLGRLSPAIPMQRPGTPEEIAAGVLWPLSDAASFVTATILEIGGGR